MAATFIVIDGTDGAGKQTQTERLVRAANKHGLRVATIDFPGYERTTSGQVIRRYLKGEFGDPTELHPIIASYPYAVDRLESAPQLRALLAEHDLVIADRYVVSNIAYQAAKLPTEQRPAFRDWCAKLDYEVLGNPREDAVIFLSLPVDVSQRLIAERNQARGMRILSDLNESNRKYLQTVLGEYQTLCAEHANWHEIDCSSAEAGIRSIDEIAAEIETIVFSDILKNVRESEEVTAPLRRSATEVQA